MSFVEVTNISKRFGDNVVLDNRQPDGRGARVVCLIGASGSGKSTLLRCVNLLEKAEEGTISVDGQVVTNGSVDVNALRRKIGIVFQAYNLFPHMTVLENVTLAPRKARGMGPKEARLRAHRAAEPDRARRQGRRVPRPALGRPAAAGRHRPRAGDGPEADAARRDHKRPRPATGGGSAEPRARARRQRDDDDQSPPTRCRSRARVADKVCFLDVGVICEEGPPEQIFSNPTEPRTREFLARIIEAGRL